MSNTETMGWSLQYLIGDVPDHAREQLAELLADLEVDELDEALQELMEDM